MGDVKDYTLQYRRKTTSAGVPIAMDAFISCLCPASGGVTDGSLSTIAGCVKLV